MQGRHPDVQDRPEANRHARIPPLELITPEVLLSEVLRLFGKRGGGWGPRGDYEISIWGVRQEAERAKGDVQPCTKK